MAKKVKEPQCSFCKAKADEVEKLIDSGNNAMICDECVFACLETLVYGDRVETIVLDVEEDADEPEIQTNEGC